MRVPKLPVCLLVVFGGVIPLCSGFWDETLCAEAETENVTWQFYTQHHISFRMCDHRAVAFEDFSLRTQLTSSEIIDVFSQAASSYDTEWKQRKYKDHIYVSEGVAEFFPLSKRDSVRILDVAAGTGMLAEELWQRGFRLLDAVDPSEGMKTEAVKKNIYTNYFLQYFDENIDLQIDSYDCLVVAAGFNVGLLPSLSLPLMVRLVKPGGLVCFCIPDDRLMKVEEYADRLEPLMTWMEEDGLWTLMDKTTFHDLYDGKVKGTVYRFQVKSSFVDIDKYRSKLTK